MYKGHHQNKVLLHAGDEIWGMWCVEKYLLLIIVRNLQSTHNFVKII